jgi:hypothetical protein
VWEPNCRRNAWQELTARTRCQGRRRTKQSHQEEHGEIISLPPNEQAEMKTALEMVGQDVAKCKPDLDKAHAVFAAVAKQTK